MRMIIMFLLVLPLFAQAQQDCYPQSLTICSGDTLILDIWTATLMTPCLGLPKYAQIEFAGDPSECYALGCRIMIEPTSMGYFIPATHETTYFCHIGRPEELNLPVLERIKHD